MDYFWIPEPTSSVDAWDLWEVSRRHCNEERQHSSPNDLTPSEFATKRTEEVS
jgi:hypothetical protein